MFVIWSGRGIVAGLAGFACLFLTQVAVNAGMHDERFYASHGWPKLLSLWVAAAVVWPLGRALNRRTEQRLLDPESGRWVLVRSGGGRSLFFVPVQYWGVIFLILGAICAVA
jgi:hypothetical protein